MVYYAVAAFLAASGLVASVNAGSVHAMHHNLHKKGDWKAPSTANATCGCTTYTTTWYGPAGLVPEPSTSSSSSSTSTSTWVAPTTSSTETPTPSPSSSSSAWSSPSSESSWTPAPTTYAEATKNAPAPTSSSSSEGAWGYGGISVSVDIAPSVAWSAPAASSSSSYGSGSGSTSANGNKWAMTYTPYTSGGQCKSASDVATDIASIKAKGFTTVRLYATDCSGIQNVGAACKDQGLKMIMGIYIDASGLSAGYEQINELTSWGSSNGWDNVEMVVAGNEAVFNGYCTASELAGFITDCKSKFKAAGFTGPITTTETLDIIQANADTFCGVVDVIAANIHPFFNTAISASDAGNFVSSQLELLKQACNGEKEAYNLETGWPSAGDANGAAIPGTSEQKTAVDAIIASAGAKSAIFSFENDDWKSPGDLGVEQFWGCASLFSDLF